jgi:hypothetical protein
VIGEKIDYSPTILAINCEEKVFQPSEEISAML